jgi:hypothetical protein
MVRDTTGNGGGVAACGVMVRDTTGNGGGVAA